MSKILAIDVGNTNTKWGWFINGELLRSQKTRTADVATVAGAMIDSAGWHSRSFAVAISSVVPAATSAISAACRSRQIGIVEVTPTSQSVFPDMHPEMGADRIADVVAAWLLHGRNERPVIVIGLGTASTMLAVDRHKNIVGGFIAPGVNLLFDVL